MKTKTGLIRLLFFYAHTWVIFYNFIRVRFPFTQYFHYLMELFLRYFITLSLLFFSIMFSQNVIEGSCFEHMVILFKHPLGLILITLELLVFIGLVTLAVDMLMEWSRKSMELLSFRLIFVIRLILFMVIFSTISIYKPITLMSMYDSFLSEALLLPMLFKSPLVWKGETWLCYWLFFMTYSMVLYLVWKLKRA